MSRSTKKKRKSASAKDVDLPALKQVLDIVEGTGYQRSEINGIETLCFRGEFASVFPEAKRGPLRRKWDDLRRLEIDNYIDFLVDIGVTPGTATLREKANRGATVLDEDEGTVLDEDEGTVLNEEGTVYEDLSNDLESLGLSDLNPKSATLPALELEALRRLSSPPLPVNRNLSSSSFPTLHPSHQFSPIMDPRQPAKKGTKYNPYRFQVHLESVERNPARFQFRYIPNYNHNGYSRKVWELFIEMAHADYDEWQAFLHGQDSILVRGPSTTTFGKPDTLCNEDCHDVKDKSKHPFPHDLQTENSHRAVECEIKDDPDRQSIWWLCQILPEKEGEEVVFNNAILSGPGDEIDKTGRKVKVTSDGDVYKMAVASWKIALSGGRKTHQQEQMTSKDLMSM